MANPSAANVAKPRRTPLVFVPAMIATGRVYQGLLDDLRTDRDVYVVEHDLDPPEPITWKFFFQEIDQIAPAGQFDIMGQSLSGPMVAQYAASFPDRVRRTVLIGPVLFQFDREPRSLGRKVRNLYLAARSGQFRRFIRALRTMRQRMGTERMRRINAFGSGLDLTPTLRKLTNTTVIWQRDEEVIPAADQARIAEYAKIQVRVTRGSHLSPALEPHLLLPTIRNVLDA